MPETLLNVFSFSSQLPCFSQSAGAARRVTINKEADGHVLDFSVIKILADRIKGYHNSEKVRSVCLSSIGSDVFSNGLDFISLYKHGLSGDVEGYESYVRKQFDLNSLISQSVPAVLPFMDGLTLGGAASLALQSRFRVASSKSLLAFPEAQLGYVLGGGASHFLPKLPGHVGMYLALTGNCITGHDLM